MDFRETVLAQVVDPSDRAVLQKYLRPSENKDELLARLTQLVRSGESGGIIRSFYFLGEEGLRALCDLVGEGTLSPNEAVPTLGRFAATESTLSVLSAMPSSESDDELSELIVRKAIELFPAYAAIGVLLEKLRHPLPSVRGYVLHRLYELFESDNPVISDDARRFFLEDVLPLVASDDAPGVQVKLLDCFFAFADGRFLPEIKSRITGSDEAEIRIHAIAKYLHLFHVQGSSMLNELEFCESIKRILIQDFDAGPTDVKCDILAVGLHCGLHDLPMFTEWLHEIERGENGRLAHEVEDARQAGLLGQDPWKLSRRQ